MHKKRVLCPFKGARRCHLHHFDAWPFSHHQHFHLKVLGLSFRHYWSWVVECHGQWLCHGCGHGAVSIFVGWFFLVRKKVTSTITKQLIHSFRCLTTFFSPTSVLFCVKVCVWRASMNINTYSDIWKQSTTSESHISWQPRATWKLDRRIPGKADVLLLQQPCIFPDFSWEFPVGSGEPTATGTVLKTFAFSHLMWIKRDFFRSLQQLKDGQICWTDFGTYCSDAFVGT